MVDWLGALRLDSSQLLQAAEQEAYSRGLVVGVEDHKSFDHRNLTGRQKYSAGPFGIQTGFRMAAGKELLSALELKNWFTTANSDAFTYNL